MVFKPRLSVIGIITFLCARTGVANFHIKGGLYQCVIFIFGIRRGLCMGIYIGSCTGNCIGIYLHRDLDRDLHRDLDRDLNRDLDRELNKGLDRDLDRDLNKDINRDLDRDLDTNIRIWIRILGQWPRTGALPMLRQTLSSALARAYFQNPLTNIYGL